MTSPCAHREHVPVEIVTNPDRTQETTPTVTVVAHLCLTCHEQLPAAWGCDFCEWQELELRRLCDPHPAVIRAVTRPCTIHTTTP